MKRSIFKHVRLAVLGWYLLVPPWVAPYQVNTAAPLSQWRYVGSFDSAEECSQAQARVIDNFTKPDRNAALRWNANVYAQGMCIASDDPRLGR